MNLKKVLEKYEKLMEEKNKEIFSKEWELCYSNDEYILCEGYISFPNGEKDLTKPTNSF